MQIVYVFLAVMLVGVSIAYAEEVTIDVPFDVDESWDMEQQCKEYVHPDSGLRIYRCYFYDRYFEKTPDVIISVEPESEPETEPEPVLEASTTFTVEPELDENQQRIEYLKNKYFQTKADLEEIRLREKIQALCRNDTLVSQTYREFRVPVDIFVDDSTGNKKLVVSSRYDVTDFNLNQNQGLKTLALAVQECIGQPFTKKSHQYDHIDVRDLPTYHGLIAGHLQPWTQERMIYEANKGIKQPDKQRDLVCANYNHKTALDMGYDCPIDFKIEEYPPIEPTNELKDYGESQVYKDWVKYQDDPNSQLASIIAKIQNEKVDETNIGGQK